MKLQKPPQKLLRLLFIILLVNAAVVALLFWMRATEMSEPFQYMY